MHMNHYVDKTMKSHSTRTVTETSHRECAPSTIFRQNTLLLDISFSSSMFRPELHVNVSSTQTYHSFVFRSNTEITVQYKVKQQKRKEKKDGSQSSSCFNV